MDICPPAIVTAACFVAIVLLDLYLGDWRRAPGHALFGVFAILLMIFICQRAAESTAWVLLLAPFVLVFLAWIIRAFSDMTKHDSAPPQEAAWAGNDVGSYGCPCPCCNSVNCQCNRPCLQPKSCNPEPRKPNKCEPKHKPCNEDSYFELWLTTK